MNIICSWLDYLQENERTVMDSIMDINDYEGKVNISVIISGF